ncbi:putative phosphatidate phosphatase [Spodoptera litura]|uniref:Phosphatidate phosphatase n=1 Tax=Spodoptera litura TaxID=69820 RepID=A0A9J7J4J6_SPOLT|nr:putative phosphatidate phosphatase [Spodoptera litura]
MAVDRLIWKIILDFLVLACVAFPILGLALWATPYHRGYDLNDMSIRLPYKDQLVSVSALAGAGFAFMVCTILLVEIVRDKKGKGAGERFLSGSVMPGWVWESYRSIGVFAFGASCQQLTSDFAKYVIGRLRPHFYEVCMPFPIANSSANILGYINDYTCGGSDTAKIQEARLSFPSSHASFSMYCAVFFIFYIQEKGKWRGSKLLRHAIQYAVLISAWFVGLSRVQDNMHHWSDVAAGFLIGATFASLVFIYVLKPKKYGLPVAWEEPPLPTSTLTVPRAVLSSIGSTR